MSGARLAHRAGSRASFRLGAAASSFLMVAHRSPCLNDASRLWLRISRKGLFKPLTEGGRGPDPTTHRLVREPEKRTRTDNTALWRIPRLP